MTMSDLLISSQLNDVLDSYGLSKTFIDYRRIVFNCFCVYVLDKDISDEELVFVGGSKRDALCSFHDTKSDFDVIVIAPEVLFDEKHMHSAKHFVSTLNGLENPVFILETGSHHGYKYLKCLTNVKDEDRFTKLRGSAYLLNTTSQAILCDDDGESDFKVVHGPALTQTYLAADESLILQIDMVLGYHCLSLPKDFDEWCNRKRNYNWPPSWIIEATKKYGCFVVGVGHPNSDTQAIEWRLSMTKTEYLLTKSFNHVQIKCYVLMKLVLKWIIQPQMKEPLSSYHVKTVMFWMSEEHERQIWRPENLADCFMSSLMQLRMFVENKRCPNYFITDVNLLEGKLEGEIYHRVLNVLDNIIREGPKVVYQCLPLNVRLNPTGCQHLNDPCYECLKRKDLLDQRIEEMNIIECRIENWLTLSDTDDDIYQRIQFSLTDCYIINEIRNESMLQSHAFTSLSVLEEMGLSNKHLYILQKEHIAKLRGVGHVSRIKMATYFYYRRRLGYCIPILSMVIKSIESSQEFELCTDDEAIASDVTEIKGVESIYLTQNHKGFQVSEIVFNPCDKRLIPPDLQDEMGRPKTVNGMHYEGWVFVDSIVYAWYLLIITLHDMRRYSGIVSFFRRFRKVCTQQPGTIRIFRRDIAVRLYDHAFMLVWVATKGFTKLTE
ncbi:uncharacterized protein [Argopecten irradians]|uniref:uncharacterized protein n=1 Tax=Argopecten irradians TaxID=31199 RepID=UPI003718C5FE